LAHFFTPTLLPQFRAMYSSYSSGFNGCVVRAEEKYWTSWVRSNLESSIGSQSAFPIEIYAAFEEWDGSDPAPEPPSPIRFLSYMFLQRQHVPADHPSMQERERQHDRVYLVREYAVTPHWGPQCKDQGRLMFLSLSQYAVRQIRHHMAQVDPHAAAQAKITVRFPWPIAAAFSSTLRIDEGTLQTDTGFMFQPLTTQQQPGQDNAAASASAASAAAVAEEAALRAGSVREYTLPGDEKASVNGQKKLLLEEAPLSSPYAASPFVLHHASEEVGPDAPKHIMDKLMQDAKDKVLFWNTDSY